MMHQRIRAHFQLLRPNLVLVVRNLSKLGSTTPWKSGFIDLAAALFVIGGVIGLIVSVLAIPISSLYPVVLPESFGFVVLVILVVGLVCSLGAIHCYSLAMKRQLSHAGIRGIVFGAILLTLSLGLVGTLSNLHSQIGSAAAILVLIAGVVCFVLRG